MPKIPTNEEFDTKLKQVHGDKFIRIQDRLPNQSNIRCFCNACGKEWLPRIKHLLNGFGCSNCRRTSLSSFKDRIKNIFGDSYEIISDIDEDIALHKQKIKMKCNVCQHINTQKVCHLLDGHGCWNCMRVKLINSQRITVPEFVQRSKNINGNKYSYEKVSDIENQKSKVTIICNVHGEFKQSVNDHLYNKAGCQKCKESKGEKAIRVFLEENGICHETNKRFPECKYKKPLPFDFYIEKLNLLIEFDGEQHETGFRVFAKKDKTIKINETRKRMENLRIQKIRDGIKTTFCTEKGITLLRISYRDYNRIGDILKRVLFT